MKGIESIFLWSIMLIWSVGGLESIGNDTSDCSLSRQKRNLPLVFPEGGTFKLLLGWAIPIKNPLKIGLVFGFNFQFQYLVPPNITFFNKYYPYVNVARKRRSYTKDAQLYEQDRFVFYNTVENAMDAYGMNGRECLLRSICEAAEAPIDHNGYMGELLHLLLSPNYDVVVDNFLGSGDGQDYGLARRAGEQMFDCRQLYPNCPVGFGLFDMITVLE